jgi:hypothetical protein
MSLSIFDDDELVESLGYSRDYHVSHHAAFSIKATLRTEGEIEEDRERSRRRYAILRADPVRWAIFCVQRREYMREYARARYGHQPRRAPTCIDCKRIINGRSPRLLRCEECDRDHDARRKRAARAAARGGRLREYVGRADGVRWVTARRAA